MRLEQAVYANAARLFLDACVMYEIEAFPSAYALAILAFEEMGKIQMMDHVCFEAVLNDGSFRMASDRMEHLFSRKMFYSHGNKQAWGMYRGTNKGRASSVERLIDDRHTLDRHKQDAFYVGFSAGRTLLPTRFRATHAYRQLKYALGAFQRIGDLPFYGVFEDSTRATKREAKKACGILQRAFDALHSPRASRKSTTRR